MTQPHPRRCETCGHYDKFFGSCKLTWYQTSIQGHKETIHPETDGKGAWLVNRVGCASHSSASEPAPEPNPCEENGCTDIENCDEICEHMRIYSPTYVRESRQKARADVLDDVIKFCETEHSAPLHEETAFRVSRYAKSLRSGGAP